MGYEVQYETMLPKTPLPFTPENWQEIGQIAKIGIQEGIMQQRQINGAAYAPLKPATIRRKQGHIRGGKKAGHTSAYPTMRLIDTGNMLENQVIDVQPNGVELSIGATRDRIGYYQQVTPGPGNVITLFFGIASRTAQTIYDYVDHLFDSWLAKA